MSAVLTDLPAGHVFEPFTFTVSAAAAAAYRAATGDSLNVYDQLGAAPPLAVAALALGSLLQRVSLPPGTLHASESLQFRRRVPIGAVVECRSVLAQRSQRGGWTVSVIESEISFAGASAVTARATVLSPA